MYNQTIGGPTPEAFVALQKNRLPQNDGRVFLKNDTEFQIELFNPTTKRLGVEIKINGNLISSSLLVIRPAVRVFLDRFIDNNNQLLFSTYQVEDGNSVIDQAIAKNGLVEVKFYREFETPINIKRPNRNWLGDYDGNITKAIFGTNSVDNFGTMDFLSMDLDESVNSKSLKRTMIKETGRVQEGATSDQRLTRVNVDFESYPFHNVEWHILPESQKPQSITTIKSYCTSCGTKQKSAWRFCPTCGESI